MSCPTCEVNRDRGDSYWAQLEAALEVNDKLRAQVSWLKEQVAELQGALSMKGKWA